MAGIDKIYLTKEKYYEFKAWCEKNKKEIKKDTNCNILRYFYHIEDYEGSLNSNNELEFPATNFPEVIDRWLWKYCKLDYIIEQLEFQYGEDLNN